MIDLEFQMYWPGFEKEQNIFDDFFKSNQDVAQNLKQRGYSKIVFESVFPPKISARKRNAKNALKRFSMAANETENNDILRFWYTGENIRPPLERDFNGFFSFDQDDFGCKNLYFPLIYSSLSPFQRNYHRRVGKAYDTKELLLTRKIDEKKIDKSVCIIGRPHPFRTAAVKEFRKYFQVDTYGLMAGTQVDEKYSIAKNYKYMLCLENDFYPGYVTEKLVEAYVCETVPLYWGSTSGNDYLNKAAFINLSDFQTIADWALYVSKIDNSHYQKISEQPLLSYLPPIEEKLRKFFGDVV